MSQNPFIDAEAPPLPTQAYRLTIQNTGQVIHVDPKQLGDVHDGYAGSVLSLMLENDADIDHTCGGVCACSTCHIYVLKGIDTSPDPIEEEEDQLDFAPAVRAESRLACQFVPNGTVDVVIEIPAWNRNEVSEDEH